jgi:ATP-binding protein involved in chromosome partitioning
MSLPLPPEQERSGAGDERFLDALSYVVDPELGEDIVSLGMVRSIRRLEGGVAVEIALTIVGCPLRDQLRGDVERALRALPGIDHVEVGIGTMDREQRAELMSRARKAAQGRGVTSTVPSTTRILGIVSGKGGVGKSSVTVNLATALAATGVNVGLLDADIWGFSVPRMLGLDGALEAKGGKMQPLERVVGTGRLKVVSMGFLSGEDDAIMWRGLVLNRAVQHFVEDVDWGALDYLLIDMPPGTGDVQMGLARMLPRTELLVVTTPALAAQKVAGRAADMARRGHLRVAGVIENMAGFTSADGELHELFGSGGGARLAAEIGVPLLASIPLDPAIAAGGDNGTPAALLATTTPAQVFAELARKIRDDVAPVREMTGCSLRLPAALQDAISALGSR